MALQCCVTLLVENNMNMDEVIVEVENETGEPSDITDIGTETVEGNLNVNHLNRLTRRIYFSSANYAHHQKSHFRLTKRRIRTFENI